jgi:hypothetical protein
MDAVVTWSTRARALFALAIPLLACLSWYSFTSTTRPSPSVGYLALGGVFAAVVLQIHFAVYRVEATPAGITETSFRGKRHIAG